VALAASRAGRCGAQRRAPRLFPPHLHPLPAARACPGGWRTRAAHSGAGAVRPTCRKC